MSEKINQKNVLGEDLESCSSEPITGWFRDGCCNTNEDDRGLHTGEDILIWPPLKSLERSAGILE